MKILHLTQPENIVHQIICNLFYFYPSGNEVKGVRNPQSKYFIFPYNTRATSIPESHFSSCLLYFEKRFETEFLSIHRINPFSSYQSVFIHGMSEIDAHFIAFRVTLALHACGESCCKGEGVSEMSLGEQMRNFKGSPQATPTFLIPFL